MSDKKCHVQVKKMDSRGNSCNFCTTPSGLTLNVNEITGYQVITRICDDCLAEVNKQLNNVTEIRKEEELIRKALSYLSANISEAEDALDCSLSRLEIDALEHKYYK